MAFAEYSADEILPGLKLEEVKGRKTYRARAYHKGRKAVFSTETAHRPLAVQRATTWYRRWLKDQQGQPRHTMSEAVSLHLHNYSPRRTNAKADFLKRWNAIRHVHDIGKTDVSDVTGQWLRAFSRARGNVAGSTAKKDMDTIRPVLRTARVEGWIESLPEFPKSVVDRNPRVPFTEAEWLKLRMAASRKRHKAKTDTERRIAQDVGDMMKTIVLGLLRPREALRLTKGDIEVVSDNEVRIHVRRKTGVGNAPIAVRHSMLRFVLVERLEQVARAREDGRLFPFHPGYFPQHFRTLLAETGLRRPVGVSLKPRDSWSLRATGICLEIQRQRRALGAADYLRIARWAGTSVARIDAHYAAFLPEDEMTSVIPAEMDRHFGRTGPLDDSDEEDDGSDDSA